MPHHPMADSELASVAAAGGQVALHSGADTLDGLRRWLGDATLTIDRVAGHWRWGAPRAPLSDVIALVNAARAQRRGGLRVLAVDVPSGMDAADGGAVEGGRVYPGRRYGGARRR